MALSSALVRIELVLSYGVTQACHPKVVCPVAKVQTDLLENALGGDVIGMGQPDDRS